MNIHACQLWSEMQSHKKRIKQFHQNIDILQTEQEDQERWKKQFASKPFATETVAGPSPPFDAEADRRRRVKEEERRQIEEDPERFAACSNLQAIVDKYKTEAEECVRKQQEEKQEKQRQEEEEKRRQREKKEGRKMKAEKKKKKKDLEDSYERWKKAELERSEVAEKRLSALQDEVDVAQLRLDEAKRRLAEESKKETEIRRQTAEDRDKFRREIRRCCMEIDDDDDDDGDDSDDQDNDASDGERRRQR